MAKKAKEEVMETATTKKVELPEYAEAVLKEHPEFESLWVNTKGWWFVPATPEHMVADCTLFTNPFFNK